MTRLEEYRFLVERSRRFMESASIQINRGFYDLAVPPAISEGLPTKAWCRLS